MVPTSKILKDLFPIGEDLREVGNQAVWSLSSCKPGNGVYQLRDGLTDTYWQSDGSQPHLINVNFRRKTAIVAVALYADYKADESYTPNRISIRAGTNFHDLKEVRSAELFEPTGWAWIDITKRVILMDEDEESDSAPRPIRAFMIQIAVMGNHQNGRDTHVRQVKIFAAGPNFDHKNLGITAKRDELANALSQTLADGSSAKSPLDVVDGNCDSTLEGFTTNEMRMGCVFR